MKKRAIKGILFVIRLALGVIFVISSISKLRPTYSDFLASIYGFELVGPKIGLFFAKSRLAGNFCGDMFDRGVQKVPFGKRWYVCDVQFCYCLCLMSRS